VSGGHSITVTGVEIGWPFVREFGFVSMSMAGDMPAFHPAKPSGLTSATAGQLVMAG
jgi:hypothetical protein